jgi:hypothetical protein
LGEEEEEEEEGKGEGEGQEREGSKSSRIGRQPISCSDRTILQHTFPLTRSCKIKTLAPSVPESNKKRCSNATALHDTKKKHDTGSRQDACERTRKSLQRDCRTWPPFRVFCSCRGTHLGSSRVTTKQVQGVACDVRRGKGREARAPMPCSCAKCSVYSDFCRCTCKM